MRRSWFVALWFLSSCTLLFRGLSEGDQCEEDFVSRCDRDTLLTCSQGIIFAVDCLPGQCFDGEDFCRSSCGDGVTSEGEDCELKDPLCNLACQRFPDCGDGFVDLPETCDDQNTEDGDGCSSSCQKEGIFASEAPSPIVEDTVLRLRITSDSSASFIAKNTASVPVLLHVEVFGADGLGTCDFQAPFIFLQLIDNTGEIASDSSGGLAACPRIDGILVGSGESLTIRLQSFLNIVGTLNLSLTIGFDRCGDGEIQLGEDCEPPNTSFCDPGCQRVPICGDNIIDPTETCDDGNDQDGDGCSAACEREDALQSIPGSPAILSSDGAVFAPTDANGFVTAFVGITNPSATPRAFRVRLAQPELGLGLFCEASALLFLDKADAQGNLLPEPSLLKADGGVDGPCPSLTLRLAPNETVLASALTVLTPVSSRIFLLLVELSECGDGLLEPGEECDPSGGGCDAQCQRVPLCGDGLIDAPETCDDANTNNSDGCSSFCQVEASGNIQLESEPNEDGTPEPSVGALEGNDFSTSNANGPFTDDVTIIGAIDPSGDEDVYQFLNSSGTTQQVRLSLFDAGIGPLLSRCFGPLAAETAPQIILRSGAGAVLDKSELAFAPPSPFFLCGELIFTLAPGQALFAQILKRKDQEVFHSYLLQADFSVCGNAVLESGEECEPPGSASCDARCQRLPLCGDGFVDAPENCDDGNTNDGDGCNASCLEEAAAPLFESEPNEDGAPNIAAPAGDFSSANAEGPLSSSVSVFGSLNPPGDEDVFAIENPGGSPKTVQVQLLGIFFGQPNPPATMSLRDEIGFQLLPATISTDGSGSPQLLFVLNPFETLYVHVFDPQDTRTSAYELRLNIN